jgi:hypothetical protein
MDVQSSIRKPPEEAANERYVIVGYLVNDY